MARTDHQLLVAWSAGDRAAGQVLVKRHVGSVYGFFRNKLQGDVDDIVQRTFLACLESLPRFRAESSFRTYLFAIARNTLLMELRARYRGPTAADASTDSVFELGSRADPSLPSSIEGHRQQVLLLRALRHVPLDDQIALELFYWEGLSSREIGDVLGRPDATIRTLLRRARQRLDASIAELGEDAGLVISTTEGFEDWVARVRTALR